MGRKTVGLRPESEALDPKRMVWSLKMSLWALKKRTWALESVLDLTADTVDARNEGLYPKVAGLSTFVRLWASKLRFGS